MRRFADVTLALTICLSLTCTSWAQRPGGPQNRGGERGNPLIRLFDTDGDGALTKEQYVKARSIAVTLDMAMENDPEARRIQVGKHTVWEIINEPEDTAALPHLESGVVGLGDVQPRLLLGVDGDADPVEHELSAESV